MKPTLSQTLRLGFMEFSIAKTLAAVAIAAMSASLPVAISKAGLNTPPPPDVTPWEPVAPQTGTQESADVYRSGQVTDIDVSSAGIVLTTAWGGVFFGGPGGFLQRSDTIPTGRTRSIARNPARGNIAVVATGSAPSNAGDDFGLGLYYTATSGALWERVVESGPFSGAWRFEKVRWGSGNTVFAVSNRGVYRSEANGAPSTWRIVYGYTNPGNGLSHYLPAEDVLDIAVDPSQPTRVYIVTGDGVLRRSTDSGDHWLSLPLPSFRRDGSPFDRTRLGRGTRIAIPKLSPRFVYLMAADSTGLYGMFHSTNYGDGSWIADDPGTCSVRPDPMMSTLAASPTDSTRLLAGGGAGRQVCVSADGGRTWSALGANSVHADHRVIVFDSAGTVFLGGDGGIATSNDGGLHWDTMGSLRLAAPTILSFDVSEENPGYFYLATWDTGLWANNGGYSWMSAHQDTTDVEADPRNRLRAWGAVGLNGADRFVTVDGGVNWDVFNGNLNTSPTGSYIRSNGTTSLFTISGRAVYSTAIPSTSRPRTGVPAPTWNKFPRPDTPEFSARVAGVTVNRPRLRIPLIVYAWLDRNPDGSTPTNKLYVYDGRDTTTSIGGVGWRPSGSELPINSVISRITSSPNGEVACLYTEPDHSIWSTSDAGAHWTNITGNAPGDIYDVLIDATNLSRIFLGTDHGVFRLISPGVWANWSRGLPFMDGAGAHISQLRAIPIAKTTYVYAAVEGRGIFRRNITSDP